MFEKQQLQDKLFCFCFFNNKTLHICEVCAFFFLPLQKRNNMDKEATLKLIEQNDNVGMYSICFMDDNISEFEKFMAKCRKNSRIQPEYQTILLALEKIMEKGALERFFRAEGKMSDNVVALSLDSRKLRLYCLRLSDKILILGNGGIKTTRTYQEDETLLGYVCTLQTFNELLKEAQQKELIKIYGTVITNIDNIIFEL